MTAELDPALINEVLVPDTSKLFFELDVPGHGILRINITALKLRYQIEMALKIKPLLSNVATSMVGSGNFKELEVSDLLKALATLIGDMTIISQLLLILVHNSGYKDVTEEQLGETVVPYGDLQSLIIEAFKRSGAVNEQVANFFKAVAEKGNDILKEATESIKKAGSEKVNSTSTP